MGGTPPPARAGTPHRYRLIGYEIIDDRVELIMDVVGDAFHAGVIRVEGRQRLTDHYPVGPPDLLRRLFQLMANNPSGT